MPEWSKGSDLRSFVQRTREFKPHCWHFYVFKKFIKLSNNRNKIKINFYF